LTHLTSIEHYNNTPAFDWWFVLRGAARVILCFDCCCRLFHLKFI